MKCALKMKYGKNCHVPTMPRVHKVPLPHGVDKAACGTGCFSLMGLKDSKWGNHPVGNWKYMYKKFPSKCEAMAYYSSLAKKTLQRAYPKQAKEVLHPKYQSPPEWVRCNSFYIKRGCRKSCTGKGHNNKKYDKKPYWAAVYTYKAFKNNCARDMAKDGGKRMAGWCKTSSLVKSMCQKSCTGKGNDYWHKPLVEESVENAHTHFSTRCAFFASSYFSALPKHRAGLYMYGGCKSSSVRPQCECTCAASK